MTVKTKPAPTAEIEAPHADLVSAIARLYAERAANGSAAMDRSEAARLFSDLAHRLEALGLLDRAAINGVARPNDVDLATYLREIGRLVISSLRAEASVTLDLWSPKECPISARHGALLGLIAVDMISNAVLYAHPAAVPGRIRIGCRREPDGGLVLQVADDGVGLPEGMDGATADGVGFQSMRQLCRQLGGELSFTSSSLGLHCQVRVPPLSIV